MLVPVTGRCRIAGWTRLRAAEPSPEVTGRGFGGLFGVTKQLASMATVYRMGENPYTFPSATVADCYGWARLASRFQRRSTAGHDLACDFTSMVRQTAALAVFLVATAVSLTTAARRRLVHSSNGNGNGRVHAHRCFLCQGDWSHQRWCPEGRARLCPWCLAGSRGDKAALPERIVSTIEEIGPARRGRHAHHCPTCLTTWSHQGAACTAGDRAVLADCPACRRQRAARQVDEGRDAGR
jgi:hypothetical protein